MKATVYISAKYKKISIPDALIIVILINYNYYEHNYKH